MSPIRMAKLETALRTVLDFKAAFNLHNVAGMMKRMSDDCVFENTYPAPDGTVHTGKETLTQFWQAFFRESPHAYIEIEEAFGLGNNRCVIRWKYRWVGKAGLEGYVRDFPPGYQRYYLTKEL